MASVIDNGGKSLILSDHPCSTLFAMSCHCHPGLLTPPGSPGFSWITWITWCSFLLVVIGVCAYQSIAHSTSQWLTHTTLVPVHAKSITCLVSFVESSFPSGNSGIQVDILWLSNLASEASPAATAEKREQEDWAPVLKCTTHWPELVTWPMWILTGKCGFRANTKWPCHTFNHLIFCYG